MKNILVIALIVTTLSSCETLMNAGAGVYGPAVSEQDANSGIKEALIQGVGKGISFLNKTDGFFGNEAYKLFLPAEAIKVENTLRSLGLGGQVDKAILQINRSAEDAVGFAKPIFIEAVREMTLTDALNIVRGPKNAATNYFREKTKARLQTAFSPVIKTSLDKLNATRYYSDIVTSYNNIPTTFKKINPDLVGYVSERATDALFDQIEKEEENIRDNPLARTTQILRKVFGARM